MFDTERFEQVIQQIRELSGTFRQAVSRYDISENEFWIWYSLVVLKQDVTQQSICTTWSLHKQTVNTIVSNMVRKGYATLEAIPGTRNHKRICLTSSGKIYGEELIQPVFQAEKRAFSRIPPEDQLSFLRIIRDYSVFLQQELQEVRRT